MGAVGLEIAKVNNSMLMLRRNEKDFLSRIDMKYRDKFEHNFALLEGNVTTLSSALAEAGLDTNDATKLSGVFKGYKKSFLDMVLIQQKIGLDPKDGLYGLLRETVHGVEKEIKTLGSHELRTDMLQLRRNEKDFMLRLDMKYVDKFNKNIDAFLQRLASSKISTTEKDKINNHIELYRSHFMALVENYQLKGLDKKEGLLGTLRLNVHDSETILYDLDDQLQSTIKEEVGSLDGLMLASNITGVILALLILSLLAWLAGGVLRPLNSLVQAMTQATEENNLYSARAH